MLTVFVVMSGENWNDVWVDSKVAVGPWCRVYPTPNPTPTPTPNQGGGGPVVHRLLRADGGLWQLRPTQPLRRHPPLG